jgi:membrane protease YdiL (CAAX protease family)
MSLNDNKTDNLKPTIISKSVFEYFDLQPVFGISAFSQVIIISALFILTTIGYFFQFKATGSMDGYPPSVSILFVPIYEEFIFRGLLLKYFENLYGSIRAVLLVSFLFGLWHLKNILWLDINALSSQILYTMLIFSPIACWITIKTRSLWPMVILHYINNFPADSWMVFLKGLIK